MYYNNIYQIGILDNLCILLFFLYFSITMYINLKIVKIVKIIVKIIKKYDSYK